MIDGKSCLKRSLRCIGKEGVVLLLVFLLTPDAGAAVSCTVTPAGTLSLTATISGTASIATVSSAFAPGGIQLNCTGDAGETFGTMQICSQYSGLVSQSPYAFTLERTDGRTVSGAVANRIVAYPLTNTGTRVENAATWAGNIGGTMNSGGSGAGVTQVNLAMDIVAPGSAIVESGDYAGTLSYTVKLISLSGSAANDDCSGTYAYDQTLATVSTAINITVPAQCTMTQPGTLDFGQHTTLSSGVSGVVSSFSVTCNNNEEKFHVYIDDGQNALSGQRRMKNADTGDVIPYDLLDAQSVAFPTAAIGTPASSGAYTRSTAGASVVINGRIPAQSSVTRAGIYTDQVTVHVEY